MHTVLFVFEFLGTTELLVIAVVALILFGPRKLPEIGRSLGKGIAEFKRASDDFKRTWEYEVEIESRKPALDAGQDTHDAAHVAVETSGAALPAAGSNTEEFAGHAAELHTDKQTVARGSTATHASEHGTGNSADEDEINAS
jgi:TatA/E family protein of Tat protein translocase